MTIKSLLATLFMLVNLMVVSRTDTLAQTAETKTPAANPADVASIDAIIAATYDVISGPTTKKRDWDRMRSLFVRGGRLIAAGPRPGGGVGAGVADIEGYIRGSAPYLEKESFFETELARRTETYGHIAHVFSTYESRHKPDDPSAFERGINSFQLMNDGKRWWIVTIYWEAEGPDNKIPGKYLSGKS
jgi:hypothetical protein